MSDRYESVGKKRAVLNFVDKILPFQTKMSHGHTCDRDLFKRDAEERDEVKTAWLGILMIFSRQKTSKLFGDIRKIA